LSKFVRAADERSREHGAATVRPMGERRQVISSRLHTDLLSSCTIIRALERRGKCSSTDPV
jgi:hypothetical protein